MKTKISYGIALCRHNKEKNNAVEILLIKKRYSYYFQSFVMGHYKKADSGYIKFLLDNMSYAEKIDILSMQYSQMWYRIWLNNPEKYFSMADVYKMTNFNSSEIKHDRPEIEIHKLYREKKNKFENYFLKDDGVNLRNLIRQSSDSEILWEIPKGRKNDTGVHVETNVDCAIREFYEETSITFDKYTILYDISPIVQTFIDNSVTYRMIYYVAKLNANACGFNPQIDYRNFDQIKEVEQIKWVTLAEVKFFQLSPKIHNRLKYLYKEIIKKFKKSNKTHVAVYV